jgi:hypothetical protein
MAKKKAVAKRNPAKKRDARSGNATASTLTPNDLPDPLTAAHVEALQVSCQFLGKTFYQGDKICYQSSEWVCGAGGWAKTGQSC